MLALSNAKHEPTGLTPEPVSRRLRLSDQEEAKEQVEEMMIEKETAQKLFAELKAMKVQTAFLLAQQADDMRETARKEIVITGWSMFAAHPEDLELQGVQLEAQTDSRERWIKEVAKRAGISSLYSRHWLYGHQTRGEALSPITIVTVTRPWQRSKLFDFSKEHAGTDKLKERFFINETEEQDWNRVVEKFGAFQGTSHTGVNYIKVQPQRSLWDRITGLPLKIAMNIAEQQESTFDTAGVTSHSPTKKRESTSCGSTTLRTMAQSQCT